MATILDEAIARLRASNPELFLSMPVGIERSPGRVLGELMRRTSYPITSPYVQSLYSEARKPGVFGGDRAWRQAGEDATEQALEDFMRWIDTRAYDNPTQAWPAPAVSTMTDSEAEEVAEALAEEMAGELGLEELKSLAGTHHRAKADKPIDHKDWASW